MAVPFCTPDEGALHGYQCTCDFLGKRWFFCLSRVNIFFSYTKSICDQDLSSSCMCWSRHPKTTKTSQNLKESYYGTLLGVQNILSNTSTVHQCTTDLKKNVVEKAPRYCLFRFERFAEKNQLVTSYLVK